MSRVILAQDRFLHPPLRLWWNWFRLLCNPRMLRHAPLAWPRFWIYVAVCRDPAQLRAMAAYCQQMAARTRQEQEAGR